MSYGSKDKLDRDDRVNSNRSHLAKSGREMFRVCPSKLSKRELEDLYFTLLENNLDLKKTVNRQQDKIRVLSTQVQRMTNNQDKLVNKDMKECSTATKAFVNDQKDFITELKETNQRLSDRIQYLNLRLSSAKLFQKTTPAQAAAARSNAPPRVASSIPKRHDCVQKPQGTPPPNSPSSVLKLSTYSQWEDESPKKATQTQISIPTERSPNSGPPCDENRCRTLMDELKHKVVTLQEELTNVHTEYSTRITRLETEVSEVRKENVRINGERTASQHELQNAAKLNGDLLTRFRSTEAKCAELAAQLSIEKRKVAELDTLLKAANMSERVQKTLDEHLVTLSETETTVVAPKETNEKVLKDDCDCSLPSKVTGGTADNKKEAEDVPGKSSPTKYNPSKSSSNISKAIKEQESPTKTRSKDRKTIEKTKDLSTRTEDRKNKEYPPQQDMTTRFEGRKNKESPSYSPPKALSPRPDERKKRDPCCYPPPKDLTPRAEERQKHEYPTYPPPKDLTPKPEDRLNLGYPFYPPPKDLSTRHEDRAGAAYPFPPPKDAPTQSTVQKCCEGVCCHTTKQPKEKKSIICGCHPPPPPQDEKSDFCGCRSPPLQERTERNRKNDVACRCPAWVPMPKVPLAQEDPSKCVNCSYPDTSGVSTNDKVNSPREARNKFSPTKEIDDNHSQLQTNTAAGVQSQNDSDELALIKQNNQLLVRTMELQNQVDNMKIGVSQTTGAKRNKVSEMVGSPASSAGPAPALPKSPHPLLAELPKISDTPEGILSSRTSVDSPPLLEHFAEDRLTCLKCCFKDETGATDSPPLKKIDKGQSPKGARTRFSPTRDKDDTKSTNTADDSGYQESDETDLLKMNKELMSKILELQKQVDYMKIGMTQMFEGQSEKLKEYRETPIKPKDSSLSRIPEPQSEKIKESRDSPTKLIASESLETKLVRHASVDSTKAHINSPPSLKLEAEFKTESEKALPFPPKQSIERVNRLHRRKLKVEVLGNPKGSATSQTAPVRPISSDETRAKTVLGFNGLLHIPDDHTSSTSDEFMVNYDSLTEIDTPKLKITEKKKLENADCSHPETVSVKSGTMPGPILNPDKLKYLENEGSIAKMDLQNQLAKTLKVDSAGSITESIPSNPELGFGIPRLASKSTEEKKAEIDSGQAKKSPAAGLSLQRERNDDLEILPDKLKLPMSEKLASNYPTTLKQTDETKKEEDCEYCAACSFDKECALRHENTPNRTVSKLAHGMERKEKIEERDLLNVLQIPNAIPTSDYDKTDINIKKNIFNNFVKDVNRKQNKGSVTNVEIANQQVPQKAIIATDQPVNLTEGPLLDQRENYRNSSFLRRKDSIKMTKKYLLKKDKFAKKLKKEDFIEDPILYAKHTCDTAVGPVIRPDVPYLVGNINRINGTTDTEKYNNQVPPDDEEAWLVERAADVEAQNPEHKFPEKTSQAITTTTNKTDTARVSTKESTRQRDVSIYRRASGTFCYRSVSVSQDQTVCHCPGQVDGYCIDHSKNKGVKINGAETNKYGSQRYRQRQLTPEQATYTIGTNRTNTTDTDVEMSYLSDLPLENEKRSPGESRPLSPGEKKTTTDATTTQSDYTLPSNKKNSISEGEMSLGASRRSSCVQADKPYINPTLAHKLETPPSHQMEAALNAITDELQRCKNLLHANRYVQKKQAPLASRSSQTPPSPSEPRPIALKPAPATQGIGDAHAPMSLFTLHIGTVVLNDEAVLQSRNKNLVLKWKFYNQPVTMTRMRPGRVIIFDFSTQYDIKITEDFLNYLKHEEMPIVICELASEAKPFAFCTLPLRDTLLLANTRADMSLALLAGAQMRDARAPNATANAHPLLPEMPEEVGVIDLWYKLHANAKLVPSINFAIAQPCASSKTQSQPSASQQVQYDQNELDMVMGRSKLAASHEPTGKNQNFADVEYTRTSNPWQQESKPRTKQSADIETMRTTSTTTEQNINYDPSKYPPIRERSLVQCNTAATRPFTPLHSMSCESPDKFQRRESTMIINEVNARIKRPRDIVYAAGRGRGNDSRSRLHKSDDETTSQVHSSFGSLRSVINRLHKRGSRITLNSHGGERRNFIEKLRKASKAGQQLDGPTRPLHKARPSNMEIYKKYENTGKMGSNRAEPSKKVTILHEHDVDEMEIEEPQRDVDLDPKHKKNHQQSNPKLDVTVLWLALNEECEAMIDPCVQRVYVAYSFLGRTGAELETPVSLPKPKHYVEKCYFNFKKTFELEDTDILKVGHMARCRAGSSTSANDKDCIIFSVVSEPAEDPLGIESCEDIGYAFLYLGDLLAYSSGSPSYTEVVPVRAAQGAAGVCGVLAVRLDGLDVVRRCLLLHASEKTRGLS